MRQTKREIKDNEKRRLIIKVTPYLKILSYCRSVDSEVSGFAKTKSFGNSVMVTDVVLLKQRCTGGSTTLICDGLSEFITKLVRKGQKPEEWNLWWHTHYNFNVFWSGIDEIAIKQLSENSKLLSVCINIFGDVIAREDGDGESISLPVVIHPDGCNGLTEKCSAEARRKVGGLIDDVYKAGRTSKHGKALEVESLDSGYGLSRELHNIEPIEDGAVTYHGF